MQPDEQLIIVNLFPGGSLHLPTLQQDVASGYTQLQPATGKTNADTILACLELR
jgi:hypothetical protein